MAIGTINITLRPIKLAFLIDPADKAGLLEAIEINTFLWGGAFNPIIPVFKRTPKAWRDRFSSVSSKAMAEGLLQAFDPDYVVLVGLASPSATLQGIEIRPVERDVGKPLIIDIVRQNFRPSFALRRPIARSPF